MKTWGKALATLLLLLSWNTSSLLAQKPTEKIITINRTSVRPDGAVEEETIIKKGKAAEEFDIEAYLEENNREGVSIHIREESADGEYVRTIRRDGRPNRMEVRGIDQAINELGRTIDEAVEEAVGRVELEFPKGEKAFLGVRNNINERSDERGLLIEVVPCSPADKAGLRDNDLILELNGTDIDAWSDLTSFMASRKPGQTIQVSYERRGEKNKTRAVLSTRQRVDAADCPPVSRGFLGVSPADEPAERGVRINVVPGAAAAEAGLQDGDVLLMMDNTEINRWEDIEAFMSGSREGDAVKISFRRNGSKQAKEIRLGAKPSGDGAEASDWDDSFNWDFNNFDLGDMQKSACLGVYSEPVEGQGARIADFTESSAAKEANMQQGDVITAINNQKVRNHDELWNALARLQPGDEIEVDYSRDGESRSTRAVLKPCQSQNKITVITNDDAGKNEERSFYIWNWGSEEKDKMKSGHVITIQKGAEGDLPAADPLPGNGEFIAQSLQLRRFTHSPDPANGPLTIEFEAAPMPTVVNLMDSSGRQLFREELNAFNGRYAQQFDLSAFSGSVIIVQVIQGDKAFSKEIAIQ